MQTILKRIQKRWHVAERAPDGHFDTFSHLERLVVQLLYNREVTDPEDVATFLTYGSSNFDPFLLKGMDAAIPRIVQAVKQQELIAVYGDYDADGVTSTALLITLLRDLGAQAIPYIPDRFDEGYGLNNVALERLAQQGVKLVITVDCGIRSVNEVAHGQQCGLDMIITDHHSIGEAVPDALAVINPKQEDCAYPFKMLAGVGIAYKVAQALLTELPANTLHAEELLDLVALGSVADLAPLQGENRTLVAQGIDRLNNSPLRLGLSALINQIGFTREITAGTIGFVIGPRLNAAGRIDNAKAAYELLVTANELQAVHLAEWLDQQNRERQQLTATMVETAREQVFTAGDQPLYFVRDETFNAGVVGLAASRITEEFYRPSLVAEFGAETTKGSARSIPEFHITEALDQCADLLARYGGHSAAAGFTINNENVPAFVERLQQIAAEQLDLTTLRPTLELDAELNLRGVRAPLVESIQALRPFGFGNRTPSFMTRQLTVKSIRTMGEGQKHMRLKLHDGRNYWSAVAFQMGDRAADLKVEQAIDAAYQLEFNEWNGRRELQLNIKDIRHSDDEHANNVQLIKIRF